MSNLYYMIQCVMYREGWVLIVPSAVVIQSKCKQLRLLYLITVNTVIPNTDCEKLAEIKKPIRNTSAIFNNSFCRKRLPTKIVLSFLFHE